MTIPEFLHSTHLPMPEVAEICGVHISQVYRWRESETVPSGAPLIRLLAASKGKIRSEDIPARKPRRRKRSAA